jgi:hypothetical protein
LNKFENPSCLVANKRMQLRPEASISLVFLAATTNFSLSKSIAVSDSQAIMLYSDFCPQPNC